MSTSLWLEVPNGFNSAKPMSIKEQNSEAEGTVDGDISTFSELQLMVNNLSFSKWPVHIPICVCLISSTAHRKV